MPHQRSAPHRWFSTTFPALLYSSHLHPHYRFYATPPLQRDVLPTPHLRPLPPFTLLPPSFFLRLPFCVPPLPHARGCANANGALTCARHCTHCVQLIIIVMRSSLAFCERLVAFSITLPSSGSGIHSFFVFHSHLVGSDISSP